MLKIKIFAIFSALPIGQKWQNGWQFHVWLKFVYFVEHPEIYEEQKLKNVELHERLKDVYVESEGKNSEVWKDSLSINIRF